MLELSLYFAFSFAANKRMSPDLPLLPPQCNAISIQVCVKNTGMGVGVGVHAHIHTPIRMAKCEQICKISRVIILYVVAISIDITLI